MDSKFVARVLQDEISFDLREYFGNPSLSVPPREPVNDEDVPFAIACVLLVQADADYQVRALEDQLTASLAGFCGEELRKNPKATEWKIRRRFDRSDTCRQIREGILLAKRTSARLTALVEGLRARREFHNSGAVS